jgi:uncharacterized membrane protein YdjX (TVP38/TMEM64 family)
MPGLADAVAAWDRAGLAGRVGFTVVYAAGMVLCLPSWVFTYLAGATFGPVEGAAVAWAGASLGGLAAFLVARRLLHAAAQRALARRPRLAALDGALADHALYTLVMLRLSPVVPFNVSNFVLGATRVHGGHVAFASIGLIPGSMLYASIGRAAAETTGLVPPSSHGPWGAVLWSVGLVATVVAVVILSRASRHRLAVSRAQEPQGPPVAPAP